MINTKNYSLTVVGFLYCLISLPAFSQQITIAVPELSGGVVKPEMLWNVTVISTATSGFNGRVQLNINDPNNRTVYNATSTLISFPRGAKSLNFNSVSPINCNYNRLATQNGWIKAGRYQICYSVQREELNNLSPLSEECFEFIVEPLSPPLLNEPADRSSIYEDHPAFSWISPVPQEVFNDLRYEVRVVELLKNQSSTYAIGNNVPVYFENSIHPNFKLMPYSYKGLEIGKEYVWQITAYDGSYSIKSDVWQFKVIKDSVMSIIEASPYITMKINKPDFGIMHQGFIKAVLTNYSTDSLARLAIYEEGGKDDGLIANIDLQIKQGENYILKELDRKTRLNENKIYQLVWVNTRGERWVVRYKPKYYR